MAASLELRTKVAIVESATEIQALAIDAPSRNSDKIVFFARRICALAEPVERTPTPMRKAA